MIKRDIPFAHAKSIYDIDFSFYHKLGVKVILTDLDNTIEPYDQKTPTPRCIELARRLKEAGFRFIIASNNASKRVSSFANAMGISYASMLRKPFSGPLKRFMEKEGIKPEEAILIGDQIQTDVRAGNGAGIKTILTEPFNKHEPIWTKINRFFEGNKRWKMMEKGILKQWEEIFNE